MQNFEKKQSVEDAINTLETSANEQAPTMSARMAESYAKNQGEARQKSEEHGAQAAFNANGQPDDQNVTLDVDEQKMQETMDEASDVDTTALVNENLELKTQLDAVKKVAAAEHDKMLRALAEADNARKRAEQDVDRERKYALEKFVRSMLPVYDALEKALELSDRNNEATKNTLDGVENTLNLFVKELASFGVEVNDPTGKPFDPNFHQAISLVPNPEVPNNHVMQTLQKGFILNGRVVRAAMVIVSKGA